MVEPREPRKPRKPIGKRDFTAAKSLREREPQHFQRLRQRRNAIPRPSQPAPQPNQDLSLRAERAKTNRDYWDGIAKSADAELRAKELGAPPRR